MLGNNVGMFTAQEPEVGEELKKKYYTTVGKRYVFKNEGTTKTFTSEQIISEKIEEEKESYSESDFTFRVFNNF